MFGRLLWGFGACAGAVSCYAICKDLYSNQSLTKTLALISASIGITPLVAPIMGAILNGLFGWQRIFYALAIFSTLLLVWIYLCLVKANPPQLRKHNSRTPLSYFKMTLQPEFFPALLCNSLALSSLFAYIASAPVILMAQLGLNQYQFSSLFAVNACAMILANSGLVILLQRFRQKPILWVSIAAMICTSLLLFSCPIYATCWIITPTSRWAFCCFASR